MELTVFADSCAGGTVASWRAAGPRPAVVCVHGAGVSSRQTRPVVRALAGRHEGWAVDLPGFGRARTRRAGVSVVELAAAVCDWADQRGVAEACLLGTSMGCQVVVETHLRRPDLARSLVLVGPTMDPRARTPGAIIARAVAQLPHEPAGLARMNAADYRDAGTRRIVASWRAAIHHPLEERLPRVRVPTLVVRGSRDRFCPQPWAEEVTRLLPAGRLRVVPGHSHSLQVGAPAALADLVVAFQREVTP